MGKKLNQELIEQIELLRSKGFSVPEISKELSVPKTTTFHYAKDVVILPEFISSFASKRGGSRKRMLLQKKKAYDDGIELLKSPTLRDKLLFTCALYWAEGSKTDFGLSNTDYELVKVYMHGLREVYGVSNDDFRISIRIYEDLDKEKCLKFWSNIVGIPVEKFVSVNVLKGKKKGKLEYGMCRIRVRKGGHILKKIMGINKAFTDIIYTQKDTMSL